MLSIERKGVGVFLSKNQQDPTSEAMFHRLTQIPELSELQPEEYLPRTASLAKSNISYQGCMHHF